MPAGRGGAVEIYDNSREPNYCPDSYNKPYCPLNRAVGICIAWYVSFVNSHHQPLKAVIPDRKSEHQKTTKVSGHTIQAAAPRLHINI